MRRSDERAIKKLRKNIAQTPLELTRAIAILASHLGSLPRDALRRNKFFGSTLTMKAVKTTTAVSPKALARLDEIQQEMRTMCQPHYDEFHKMEVANGFVKITIPKKTRR